MTFKQVIEGIILVFCSFSLVISLITLILLTVRIRPLISNVSLLLTCNTYITLIGCSFTTLLLMIYGVYDELHSNVSFNDFYCQLRSYFTHVFICAFYYSCILQATFRLFRIVFKKRKLLQSRKFFLIAISIQWLLSFIYILVYLLSKSFEYQLDIRSCWLSFKNILVLSTAMTFMYATPLILISLMYTCIVQFIRKSVSTQHVRQNTNKRDVLVVTRIVILLFTATSLGIPTGILLIIYIINNTLKTFAYHIQGLSLTGGLLAQSIAMGFITPQVRDLFKKPRQIHPTINGETAA